MFTWLWVIWISFGVLLELVTLTNSAKGDTLSENIWTLLSNPTWGKFTAWMLFAFLIWLSVHFVTKGKWA